MGRGSSKASARSSVTQATVQNGTLINLPSPLVYGTKDAAVSDTIRPLVDNFETSKKQSKIEYSYCVDANGNVIETRRGGTTGVRVSNYAANKAEVISHNHPRGANEYVLGGTFSDADISFFCKNKVQTFRASAAEGTYSITKSSTFNGRAFNSFVQSTYRALEKTSNQATKAITRDYNNGLINHRTAKRRTERSFNQMLIGMHNALLSNQGTYGYTYTLE